MMRMNKKIFAVLVLCACLCILVIFSAMPTNSMAQEDPKEAAKRAALMGKAAQILKSKQWTIYVTVAPATAKSAALVETDTLSFTDRSVLSSILSGKDYAKSGSNYSLFIQDNATAVWETMQMHTNEKDMAFLRGELNLNSGVMHGAVIYKPSKGKGETYSYSTLKPGEAATASTPAFKPIEIVPKPKAAPAPQEAEKTKEPVKKKKKGWWW